jgi:uncharacterized phage-associated protein
MSYSSIVVANSFLELARDCNYRVPPVTNMKLQKLVYIAHGFTLAMLDAPLISSHVHAFQWGPVVPTLYEAVKRFGSGAIIDFIATLPNDIQSLAPDSTEAAVVQGVWDKYGKLSAAELSNITHKPGTPWSDVWSVTPFAVIPNDLIQHHYLELIQAHE